MLTVFRRCRHAPVGCTKSITFRDGEVRVIRLLSLCGMANVGGAAVACATHNATLHADSDLMIRWTVESTTADSPCSSRVDRITVRRVSVRPCCTQWRRSLAWCVCARAHALLTARPSCWPKQSSPGQSVLCEWTVRVSGGVDATFTSECRAELQAALLELRGSLSAYEVAVHVRCPTLASHRVPAAAITLAGKTQTPHCSIRRRCRRMSMLPCARSCGHGCPAQSATVCCLCGSTRCGD